MNIRIDRIRELLRIKEISANEMLSSLGQSVNNLTRWEKGLSKPSHSSLLAIANYLHVDVRYLLDMTDSPYGDDLIETMQDKLLDAGAEITQENDDNGVGEYFTVKYEDKYQVYQEREFKDICYKLRIALTDGELAILDKFCREEFCGEVFPEYPAMDKDDAEFVKKYSQLSPDSKTIINAKIIEELRRSDNHV